MILLMKLQTVLRTPKHNSDIRRKISSNHLSDCQLAWLT